MGVMRMLKAKLEKILIQIQEIVWSAGANEQTGPLARVARVLKRTGFGPAAITLRKQVIIRFRCSPKSPWLWVTKGDKATDKKNRAKRMNPPVAARRLAKYRRLYSQWKWEQVKP